MNLYYLNITIHVLAAIFWVGGMFFLAVVGAPILRRVEPGLRVQLFRDFGTRFKHLGWAAIAVLVVTGVLNMYFHGWLHANVLRSAAFWSTPVGFFLACKLISVAVLIGISAVHDFVFGPAASRAKPGSKRSLRLRRWAAWLARTNAIVALVVIIAAVHLARG